MTWRGDYRDLVRAALAAADRFSGVTVLQSWSGTIGREDLPIIGVVTPSEMVSAGSSRQFERGTLLQVIVKRAGSDTVEDDLDEDSEAIESAVLQALFRPQVQCFPQDIAFSVNGEGRDRVGTVVVTFRITSWRSAP